MNPVINPVVDESYLAFLQVMRNYDKVLLQPHDIPDPDAIASSFGLFSLLEYYGIPVEVLYVENVEKANSKRMMELFDIPMTMKTDTKPMDENDLVLLIDTQTGHSNVTDLKGSYVGVIDHHQFLGNKSYIYADVRPRVGACSSIVASYYKGLCIEPNTRVATALLYGIMTDTDHLVRSQDQLDLEMFYWLYKLADMDHIRYLRMNEIGLEDLEAYTRALENIEIYESICFVDIGDCNDSLLGTISDMVFTIENVDVIVSYAKRDDGIKLSIRSGDFRIKANNLVSYIIDKHGTGGGHDEMAGGFIAMADLGLLQERNFDTYVRYRTIRYAEMIRE